MVRLPFMPREAKFYDLFEESARNMGEAARSLKALVDNWDDVGQEVEAITDLEHKGDTITHEIIAQLHRTFVTPFDREDIAQLAQSMDDVVDFIHAASGAMLLYRVERPNQRARELADIIVQGTAEIERAMPKLRNPSKLKHVLDCCVELNRLENKADVVYRSARAELFDDSKDMAHVIKWREIFEYMESATDRCEDVANVLEGVALKHA
ncbi:MAG: DUF47 domain-containing protein [Chloroflexota bacterium]